MSRPSSEETAGAVETLNLPLRPPEGVADAEEVAEAVVHAADGVGPPRPAGTGAEAEEVCASLSRRRSASLALRMRGL